MFSDMIGAYDRPNPPTSEKRKWCKNESRARENMPKGRVRCPDCSRLLYLREIHCVGGEILGWKFPPHKEKMKKKKMATRANKSNNKVIKKAGRKGRKD